MPKTGQPDFARLTLDYIPDKKCIELKSLKLYIWSYRDEGTFHEAVTNQILDDLVAAMKPRFIRLTSKFYVRGGIFTNVVAEHRKKAGNRRHQCFLRLLMNSSIPVVNHPFRELVKASIMESSTRQN